ncbi:ATP-grasp domain-containing protein [Streptomyces sp. NBC_00687]|uniref:ATP-grasp domain-containing protein n=1 Tax=Streptomyces sp. NBC_00687 TaxID=2975807 RepID=UPI00225A79B5|nr:ATP-grasp domain-containing protein [Streptomyces sp. NBC_00687]MCX4918995.1 ATP-grasp domain-containing protein [Streptomyces sp. NBC_00687]
MSSQRILLLGGTDRLLHKAAGLDLDIVNIRRALDLSPAAARMCSTVQAMALDNVDGVTLLVEQLHADRPFTRIICHSEPLQMLAGHLSTSLGIPGSSFETVRLLRDKYALRSLLSKTGFSSIAAEIVTSREELSEFVEKHSSAVVKPRSGGGSVGVHFVRDPNQVDGVWRWAEQVGLTEMLAEEILVGAEVSLEFFSVNGRHLPIAATTKEFGDGAVELGHAVPAPLTPQQFTDASRLVEEVLSAVGITWGPSHTEIVFTPHGPELIESHSRRAGGHINELVSLAHGVDMERLAFQLAADPGMPMSFDTAPARAAAIRFLAGAEGQVVGIHGVSEAAACTDVAEVEIYVSPGDRSHGLRWSGDYAGHVIARGDTATEAMREANRQASRIWIETRETTAGDIAAGCLGEEERAAFDAFDQSMARGK